MIELTAADVLAGVEPLLQGVLDALGHVDSSVLDVLESQIRASLTLGTRESTLPLVAGANASSPARELTVQAETIGAHLAGCVSQSLYRLTRRRIELPAGPLAVRSHCDGHLLTPPAADLLLGRRGGARAMMLYNEWLHQVVLLRDALLPFTNWWDVPLRVTSTGLRVHEQAREKFLTELLVRRVRHSSVVDFARQVVTGASGPAGYGFDHDGGTVLPAVLDQSPLTAPRYLLTWRTGTLAVGTNTAVGTSTYVPEVADYYAAPRILVEHLPEPPPGQQPSGFAKASVHVTLGPVVGDVRTADLEVLGDGVSVRVDLGQALRGHRFAARPALRSGPARQGGPRPHVVDAESVLNAPALVSTALDKICIDATGLDDQVVLALLGRVYPDDVTLRVGPWSGLRQEHEESGRFTIHIDQVDEVNEPAIAGRDR